MGNFSNYYKGDDDYFFRAFMVDKDYAEINALSSIFPESAILLCWYHVMQVNQFVNCRLFYICFTLHCGIQYECCLIAFPYPQAVQRWLSKTESGVHGPSNLKTRDDIMSFFYKLKACKTVSISNL